MRLEQIFDYILVAISSTVVFSVAVRKLALRPESLRKAFEQFAECIGASIVFFLLNVVIGIVGVFLVRGVWRFLGLYVLSGFMLVIFSVFQGFLFQLWWRRSRTDPDNFLPK